MEHDRTSWEDRRAATLKDVAARVGVSEATASVVLNGSRSGTRVSAATRQAVVEAAAHLGYRPNSVARALQAGRNHRIGVYSGRAMLDARNLFFAELFGGLCLAAHEHHSNVVLHTAGDEPERLLELVSSAALDGLVVHAAQDDPIMPLLGELRAPAIAVADPIPGLPSVVVNDELGGRLQAEHLAAKGHRHVLYMQSPHVARSAQLRMNAFIAAAQELRLRTTVRYESSFECPLSDHDYRLMRDGPDRATAFIGWQDRVAEIAANELHSRGLSIPGDVAVVGFDGFGTFYRPYNQLTTIKAPWFDVGRTAVDLLAALVRGESIPNLTTLDVVLAEGKTT